MKKSPAGAGLLRSVRFAEGLGLCCFGPRGGHGPPVIGGKAPLEPSSFANHPFIPSQKPFTFEKNDDPSGLLSSESFSNSRSSSF